MIRRLLIIAAALSLLLCLSSGVLWLEGYTNRFWAQTSPPGVVYAFKIWDGDATLYRIDAAPSRRRAVLLRFPLGRGFVVSGLAAIVCAGWLARPRKRVPGHCESCGYDLRASTGRCPECGEPIDGAVN